ncbi:MAG: hypothetical protein ACLRZG_08885 [Streptococcus sp.]
MPPNDPSFDHTRKSLAVEFEIHNNSVVVIANHLKSKIGKMMLFSGASQPAVEHTLPTRSYCQCYPSTVQEGQQPKTTLFTGI